MVQGRTGRSGRRRRAFWALALPAVGALAAGCTAGEEPRSAGAPTVAEGLTELGRRLPQRIRTARQVQVGSDVSYAPVEFYDAFAPDVLDRPVGEPEPQVRGIDPDLAAELGRKPGVRFAFVNTGFDQLIASLQAERFDVIISSMTATPERAKVSGQGRDFQVVGEQIDPGPYGIGVRKDDGELQSVLRDALRAIIEDGSYDRVLTKWNVTDGALKTAKVIGAA
jgi:ABC-type amino acid transport substrate-binding protein